MFTSISLLKYILSDNICLFFSYFVTGWRIKRSTGEFRAVAGAGREQSEEDKRYYWTAGAKVLRGGA